MNAPVHIHDRVRLSGLRAVADELAKHGERFDAIIAEQVQAVTAATAFFDRIRDAANARRWAAEEAGQ